MFNLTLGEVASAVNGTVFGDKDLIVTDLTTDSRTAKSGDLFAAIVGARVDGHDKVADAIASGAVATICTKPVTGDYVLVNQDSNAQIDSVITALGKLASFVRAKNSNMTVIGITGSSGKTTTKDVIGQVLATHGATYAPAGSPNNELGLPQTILQAPADTKFLVAEMGMRGLGHIKYLVQIAKPNISVVTNVGQAHIGEVGSIENIAIAKSEIVTDLTNQDFAVLNFDDVRVRQMADKTKAKVFTYGFSGNADFVAENVVTKSDGTCAFDLIHRADRAKVSLQIPGEHNVYNALASAAVAKIVGMTIDQIAKALNQVTIKSKWRMEVQKLPNSITLINDAYNANPESMAAALKTLASIETTGRRWAILGTMHELGEQAMPEHDRIGRLAVRLNIDQLVVVGDQAKALHLGAAQEGSWDGESVWFKDFSQACDYICKRVKPNDVLLFKASRSEEFDLLAQLVAEQIIAEGEK
jgi:UDP-N-acetylmuramoyl-tripeptide--D-alanyl-D-alanine ligase